MKKIQEFLVDVLGIALFYMAVSVMLLQFQSLSKSYQMVKSNIVEEQVLYEGSVVSTRMRPKEKEEIVSKKELIIQLVSKFSYPIQINNQVYWPDTFDYTSFDFSVLEESYKKQYLYNKDGTIQQIKYKEVEKRE